ncbi:MAG: acyltransferase [Phaeodactylibacter sp.]|nr:acyltransferase [Phaeodactylibacter sp.]
MSTKKDYSVETLRGFAIILVVMGHVIGSASDGGMKVADDSGWRYLYFTFEYIRMPLFTVISGWVYSLRPVSIGNYKDFTTKKIRRIIFPMAFVGTAYFLLQYIVPGTNKTGNLADIWQIYIFPYTLYWYLPSLFLVFLTVGLIDAFKGLEKLGQWVFWTAFAFALLYMRNRFIPETSLNYFSYKGGIYLFPYFMIGVGIHRFKSVFDNVWFNRVVGLIFFITLIIQQLVWFDVIQYDLDNGTGRLIGVSGTILMFRLKWKVDWLIYFGSFAYSIYLFHSFGTAGGRIVLKSLGVTHDIPIFLFSLAVGMLAPILAEKVLDRWGITRMLFLGRSYKPRKKKEDVPKPVVGQTV